MIGRGAMTSLIGVRTRLGALLSPTLGIETVSVGVVSEFFKDTSEESEFALTAEAPASSSCGCVTLSTIREDTLFTGVTVSSVLSSLF